MCSTACPFLRHSLNPLLAICPSALEAFLSTILICFGGPFSTCTVLTYKMWLNKRDISTAAPDMRWKQWVSLAGQSLDTVNSEINNMLLGIWSLWHAICAYGRSQLLEVCFTKQTGPGFDSGVLWLSILYLMKHKLQPTIIVSKNQCTLYFFFILQGDTFNSYFLFRYWKQILKKNYKLYGRLSGMYS